MPVVEDVDTAENGLYLVLILAGLGLAIYVGYEVFELGNSLSDTFSNLWSNATQQFTNILGNAGTAVASAGAPASKNVSENPITAAPVGSGSPNAPDMVTNSVNGTLWGSIMSGGQ